MNFGEQIFVMKKSS